MKLAKNLGRVLLVLVFICLPISQALADGGYFSSRSAAVSADQRAIIIKNGDEINMIFSTGYTGKGGDFAWIIPTPVPPAIEDVSETGKIGETAFQLLGQYTAPGFIIAGGGWGAKEESTVTVYGTVTLQHYKVSILGAGAASPLLDWLQNNGYRVDPSAERILDAYIHDNWSFVAVKLNLGGKLFGRYMNEFLPPLNVKYRYERPIFPLRISSISTAKTARITLYVIAESTVSSSNLPSTTLEVSGPLDEGKLYFGTKKRMQEVERVLEDSIRQTAGREGRSLVVLWEGGLPDSTDLRNTLDILMGNTPSRHAKAFLTRLETRIEPSAMTEDIELVLDPAPRRFDRVILNEVRQCGKLRQLNGFSGIRTIIADETGQNPVLAIRDDGTVWGWNPPKGCAEFGEPVQVSGMSGVVAISTGGYHNAALKDDGTVWAWGTNEDGQLGIGTTIGSRSRSKQVQVRGLSDVVAIAAGCDHSLAVKNDGTVWAWGSNDSGQLGDGTTTTRSMPVRVRGLSDVVAIAAGCDHSLAVKNDGTVWAWGSNESGQLGDGTTTTRSMPVRIRGLSDVKAIASRLVQSLVVKSDGTVWAWGWGWIGEGSTTGQISTPIQFSGLTEIISIGRGSSHIVALKDDGTVWTWGNNNKCQLGDGSRADSLAPVHVRGLSGVVAIAAARDYTVALKDDGTLWAWGCYW